MASEKSEWSKRVMFKCIRGQWVPFIDCKPEEFITPADMKMLQRSLKVAYREYMFRLRVEQKVKRVERSENVN